MKQIISALFLCMLLSAVPGLQAQNIQLHYDLDVLCMIKICKVVRC